MTEDHLFADAVGHCIQVEPARVLGQGGMEHHLQQHVAQFFAQQGVILAVDGLQHLAAFLRQTAAQTFVGLYGVPGAAAGVAQDGDDLAQIIHSILFPEFKIYHNFSLFAIIFSNFERLIPPFDTPRWIKTDANIIGRGVFQRMCRIFAIFSPFGISARSSRVTMRKRRARKA